MRVRRELTLVTADERLWLDQHVAEVIRLKLQMHRMFDAVGGRTACAECDGACCERGQQHMTLVEVLTALLREIELPSPEADATCPFLTRQGCSLSPEMRPFNCVTFNCEQIEDCFNAEQQYLFYALEKQLRELYAEFEVRYVGASLRGLVIRAERLGEARLLARPPV